MLRLSILSCIGAFVVAASLAGAAVGSHYDFTSAAAIPLAPHRPIPPHGRPISPTPVPKHVLTWANDDTQHGGALVSPAPIQTYLNYAVDGKPGHADKNYSDCDHGTHCYIVQYFDPNAQTGVTCDGGTTQPALDYYTHGAQPGILPETHIALHGTPPPAMLSTRIARKGTCSPTTEAIWMPGVGNSDVQTFWKNYINGHGTNHGGSDSSFDCADLYMEDSSKSTIQGYTNDTTRSSTLEYSGDPALLTALTSFNAAMTHGGFCTGGSTPAPYTSGQKVNLLANSLEDKQSSASVSPHATALPSSASNVIAQMCELCYQENDSLDATDWVFALNTASQVEYQANSMYRVLYQDGTGGTVTNPWLANRQTFLALDWLYLKYNQTIFDEAAENDDPNSINVFPEELLVPDEAGVDVTMGAFSPVNSNGNGSGCDSHDTTSDHGAVDLLISGSCGFVNGTSGKAIGVYTRGWFACYQNGTEFAAVNSKHNCRTIVNGSSAGYTFLCSATYTVSGSTIDFTKYTHRLSLKNGALAHGLPDSVGYPTGAVTDANVDDSSSTFDCHTPHPVLPAHTGWILTP